MVPVTPPLRDPTLTPNRPWRVQEKKMPKEPFSSVKDAKKFQHKALEGKIRPFWGGGGNLPPGSVRTDSLDRWGGVAQTPPVQEGELLPSSALYPLGKNPDQKPSTAKKWPHTHLGTGHQFQ